jgi:BMFP domain-containing protein YqiC
MAIRMTDASSRSVNAANKVNEPVSTVDRANAKQSVNTVDIVNAAALLARIAALEARVASLEASAMPALPLPVRKPASAERVAYMREYMRKRRAGA